MTWKSGTFITTIAIGALVATQPATVQAQALGSFMKRLGREVINSSPKLKRKPRKEDASEQDGGDEGSSKSSRSAIPAPPGVVPWPVNAGQVSRPQLFEFSADLVAEKEAFKQASSFPCMTCEGSRDFDSWRRHFGHVHESYSTWSKILEAWTVGRDVLWKGQAHDGVITVLSEVPVGEFRCRQLRHRMTSKGPKPVVTERAGLICLAKQEYSSVETWHEVF